MKGYAAVILMVLLVCSMAYGADTFSRDIIKVDIGQTKSEVESVMGPPDESTVEEGLSVNMWKLDGKDGFLVLAVSYGSDQKVGLRMTIVQTIFAAEVTEMKKTLGNPIIDEKERKVWKVDTLYCILQDQKNGRVAMSTCTEEIFRK